MPSPSPETSSSSIHSHQLIASPPPKIPPPSPPTLPSGFRDAFLERRYRDVDPQRIENLARCGALAFLSKATHIDELYDVRVNQFGLEQGLYRIRNEGSDRPLLTLKHHGTGADLLSETIDIVHPDDTILRHVRTAGTLQAVLSKVRVTYASKNHPHCLLHVDTVEGLGTFIDVKADDKRMLDLFLEEINLPNDLAVGKSYLLMKRDRGISQTQLQVWKLQQRFEDYIMGVVSGTLTPLAFLATTAASGGSKTAMILALLTAGLCDGFSDAVAASQTTQSDLRPTFMKQLSLFTKTLAGKAVVPMTFIPCVILASNNTSTIVSSGAWASVMLAATATIQAVAHERAVIPAVAKIIGLSATAVALGTLLGKYVPPIVASLLAP